MKSSTDSRKAWYTDNKPTSDAQVAAHFSQTRPILGICLKRYSMLPNGTAVKRRTRIDIPLEIGLPSFISDDNMSGDGAAFGNFKLSLQSVVCHQGVSVDSGHYISFVRSPDPGSEGRDQWMRFDDLAQERVLDINIDEQLKHESPYLLFYQVMPIEDDDPHHVLNGELPVNRGEMPPSYADSTGSRSSKVDSGVEPTANDDTGKAVPRPSIDTSISEEGKRGRSSMTSDRRQSVVFSDASNGSLPPSAPAIDISSADRDTKFSNFGSQVDPDGTKHGPTALTASRGASKASKASSKSRPNSQAGDGRLGASLSKLANRMSRDKLASTPSATSMAPDIQTGKSSRATSTNRDSLEEATRRKASLPADVDKVADRARLRKDGRDKTKTTARDHHLLTKGQKPDRECTIM